MEAPTRSSGMPSSIETRAKMRVATRGCAHSVPNDLKLADFDFELPARLIAQRPLADRAASRLLHVAGLDLADRRFSDLPGLLEVGDLLLLNDTRVIKARLLGAKPSGGRVEALIERVLGPRTALAMLRTSHSPRIGQTIDFSGAQAYRDRSPDKLEAP